MRSGRIRDPSRRQNWQVTVFDQVNEEEGKFGMVSRISAPLAKEEDQVWGGEISEMPDANLRSPGDSSRWI